MGPTWLNMGPTTWRNNHNHNNNNHNNNNSNNNNNHHHHNNNKKNKNKSKNKLGRRPAVRRKPLNRASRPCRPAKPPAEGRSFSYTAARVCPDLAQSPKTLVIYGVFCASKKTKKSEKN